jgi:hypothetical protein
MITAWIGAAFPGGARRKSDPTGPCATRTGRYGMLSWIKRRRLPRARPGER